MAWRYQLQIWREDGVDGRAASQTRLLAFSACGRAAQFEPSMEDFVAGAAGGASGLLIGHPMEVVKVQQQVSTSELTGLRGAAEAVLDRGISQGVFRGMALPLASFTVINSVFFGVYGCAMGHLTSLRPDCHYGNVMLAGMSGGAAQLPLMVPIEVVKTAMQAQLTRTAANSAEFYRGPIDCAVSIVRREGLRGLNRGFCLTFIRDVPSYGLYMLIYDWLVQRLSMSMKGETAATLLAGGIAGSVGWLSVLPIDTVKSNLQADAGSPQRRSGLSVAKQLYDRDGIRGFFRGGLIVTVRSFPVSAVTFFVWHRTLKMLKASSDQ